MFDFFKNKTKEKDTSKLDAAIEKFLSTQHPDIKEAYSDGNLQYYLNNDWGEMVTIVILMSKITYIRDDITEVKSMLADLKTSIESIK